MTHYFLYILRKEIILGSEKKREKQVKRSCCPYEADILFHGEWRREEIKEKLINDSDICLGKNIM